MALPSIIKHTVKRFVSLIMFMLTGALLVAATVALFAISNQYLGSGIYGAVLALVLLALSASYYVARSDVEDEDRMQARVLRELSKD